MWSKVTDYAFFVIFRVLLRVVKIAYPSRVGEIILGRRQCIILSSHTSRSRKRR